MRTPSGVNGATDFQESRPFVVLRGIEDHVSVRAVRAGSRVSRGDRGRTSEQFRAGRQVERVDAVNIVAAGSFGHGDQINGVARPVDNRRGSNADLGSNLAAAAIIAGSLSRGQHRFLPEDRTRAAVDAVGVKGIHAIVLGHNVQNVFRSAIWDGQVRKIERLSVHVAVDGKRADLPEFGLIHVGGSKHGLVEVLPGAQVVVVIGRHVSPGGRRGDRIHSERRGGAGDAPRGIRDHHIKCRPGVADHGRQRRIARRGRAANIDAIFLPLIGGRGRSGGNDLECRGLSHVDRLVRRLCGDFRSSCGCRRNR